MAPITWLTVLWVAWVAGWLVAARWTAKTVARQPTASFLVQSILIGGGAVLLFFRPSGPGILVLPLLPRSIWIAWAGVGLVIVGLGFTAWARVHLGRFWSSVVTLKADHALIRTGPYALVRHPIYSGLLLALIGTAIVRGTAAAPLGLALMTLGVVLKIRQEERLLAEHFGDAYRAYHEQVPALVPRVGRRFSKVA
jgi:protein-S-isoprenylcysteine O-methyltransferase Ste14